MIQLSYKSSFPIKQYANKTTISWLKRQKNNSQTYKTVYQGNLNIFQMGDCENQLVARQYRKILSAAFEWN